MQFLARSVRKGKLYNGVMHNICYPNLRSLWIHEDVFVENEFFFQISELNHVGLKIVRTEPFYLSESDCLFLLHNLQSLL